MRIAGPPRIGTFWMYEPKKLKSSKKSLYSAAGSKSFVPVEIWQALAESVMYLVATYCVASILMRAKVITSNK